MNARVRRAVLPNRRSKQRSTSPRGKRRRGSRRGSAAEVTQVAVPDIGDFSDVPVIEVLVSEGETVEVDTPLVTLESDKATMEIPVPVAGVVHEVLVQLGDKVSEGTPIAT